MSRASSSGVISPRCRKPSKRVCASRRRLTELINCTHRCRQDGLKRASLSASPDQCNDNLGGLWADGARLVNSCFFKVVGRNRAGRHGILAPEGWYTIQREVSHENK